MRETERGRDAVSKVFKFRGRKVGTQSNLASFPGLAVQRTFKAWERGLVFRVCIFASQ